MSDSTATAPQSGRRFEGQVALVTGSSRGIGLGIASRLNAEGATVILTARNPEPLAEAVAQFPDGAALGIAGKSGDPAHRAEVLGTLAWIQGAVHHEGLNFRDNRGRVVSISSVAGERPSPGISFYGISKAAVSHLTKSLAVELGPDIRVNAVAPAVVKTNFATALYEGKEEEVASTYPVRRLGTPEDVAAAVAYLASADADWITAQVLTADGGVVTAGGTA